ncbi:MAG: M48 family metallopeptidase [Capsulimonadaceae bacterium]
MLFARYLAFLIAAMACLLASTRPCRAQRVFVEDLNGYGLMLQHYSTAAQEAGVDWPGVDGTPWGTRIQISNDMGDCDITCVTNHGYGLARLLAKCRRIAPALGYPNADYHTYDGNLTVGVDIELNKYMSRTKKTSDMRLDLAKIASVISSSQLTPPLACGIEARETLRTVLMVDGKRVKIDRYWIGPLSSLGTRSSVTFHNEASLATMALPLVLLAFMIFGVGVMIIAPLRSMNKPIEGPPADSAAAQRAYDKLPPVVIMMLPVMLMPLVLFALSQRVPADAQMAAAVSLCPVPIQYLLIGVFAALCLAMGVAAWSVKRRMALTPPEIRKRVAVDRPNMTFLIPLLVLMILGPVTLLTPIHNPVQAIVRRDAYFAAMAIALLSSAFLAVRQSRKLRRKLTGGPAYDAVVQLAEKAGVRVRAVTLITSSRANAFASAINTVGLTTALVEEMDPADVQAVIAHEIAHLKLGHLRRTLVISLAAITALFGAFYGVTGWIAPHVRYDGAVILRNPVLFIVPMYLLLFTVVGAGRRKREMEADDLAAKLVGDSERVAGAIRRLHEQNAVPTRLKPMDEAISSHPSLAHRLDALTSTNDRDTSGPR